MDKRTEQYANELSRLIKIETISETGKTDGKKFEDFRQTLREMFPNVFDACEYEEFNGGFLLRWKGSGNEKPILLMNHHDVVEASGRWQYAPFSGTIAEGKVWGRGTLDTKGGLWAMLRAADELAAEGYVPERDVYFESASTEETDGVGAQTIAKALEERKIHFDTVLDEGGMMMYDPIGGADGTFAMIGMAEKGCADIKFVARSNGGHASTPGKNTPLVRLGKFMAAAEKSNIFKVKIPDTIAEMFRRIAPAMGGALGLVCGHPKLFAPLIKAVVPQISATAGAMMRTTIAFTMAGGSDGLNVLPQEAWVTGNMRFSHHQGGEASIAAICKLAEKFDVRTEIIDPGFSSGITDYNGSAFRRVENAVKDIFPDVVSLPYIMTGASDSRYFDEISDGVVRFVPFLIDDNQLASIHGINENVDLSCLAPAVDFYKHIITEGSYGK